MDAELERLLEASKAALAAMTPEAREAMYAEQRRGYAEAEASWPKPRYQWVNGVKVYETYADYCNG